jgi:hypothetical protein
MKKNCMKAKTSIGIIAMAVFFEKNLRYHGRLIVIEAVVSASVWVLALSFSSSVSEGGVSLRTAVYS